jgi:hypothetical protein
MPAARHVIDFSPSLIIAIRRMAKEGHHVEEILEALNIPMTPDRFKARVLRHYSIRIPSRQGSAHAGTSKLSIPRNQWDGKGTSLEKLDRTGLFNRKRAPAGSKSPTR